MVNFNSVLLIGKLTNDPEVLMTPEGDAICRFRVEVQENYKRADAQRRPRRTVVHVEAHRALADVCSRYLTRGREVFVLGKIETASNRADDIESGTCLRLRARTIQFLGGRRDQDSKKFEEVEHE